MQKNISDRWENWHTPLSFFIICKSAPKYEIIDAMVYTIELAERFCAWVADGRSVRRFAAENNISVSTIYYWVSHNDEFREMYISAQAAKAEMLVDDVMDIVDEEPERDADGNIVRAALEWQRLRADKRIQIAEKLYPRKYGNFKMLEHSGEIKGSEKMVIVLTRDEDEAAQLSSLDQSQAAISGPEPPRLEIIPT